MKPCFGYIRVSTQKQGEGVSLEAQRDAILAFAASHNLSVVEWFEEKETAAKSGRPIFNRMLRHLRRGLATGLIMHKIDRSARNLRDWAIISELPDIGVDVYIATETLDFRSRGGRLTADIQAVIAADYIRNLREETIKGLDGRLKQGLYPFRAPIGYIDNGRGKPKTPCPQKAPLVRLAFDLYARHEVSFRTLQSEMERRGLRNHRGSPLTLHGIETLLKNLFYCGIIEIKRTGKTYKGVHEPIVSAKTFAKVQDIRTGRAGKKVTRHNHLYRGLFRCGLCYRPMSPELQKGHVYYRCHDSECSMKTVREDVIEKRIVDSLRELEFTPIQSEELKTKWDAWIASDERSGVLRSVEMQIATTNGRLERLTDLLLDGAINRADHDAKKRSLTIELARLQGEKHEAERYHLAADKMQKFVELMNNLTALHDSANPEEKRAMVRNLFSNRTVMPESVELEPYDWIAERNFSDLSPMVTHIDTLLELFPEPANDNTPPKVQQWKKNFEKRWA